MKIIIEATNKEIADLILQLQGQHGLKQVQKEREPFTKKSCQTIRLPYSSKVYEVDDT